MIEKYIQEFAAICGYIKQNMPEHLNESRLYIEPARLRKMLDKNLFEESGVKLRVWRNLGWIECDGDKQRFSKKIYVAKGKTRRMAVLNRTAYEQISELLQTTKDDEKVRGHQQ